MSLFAGVFPSAETLERIVAVQRQMIAKMQGKASWTQPEKMHITLRFYGSCEDSEIAVRQMEESLSDVRRFSFHLESAGGFPSMRRARVAFLEGESAELVCIADRLKDEGERKPHPHLTLARFREPAAVHYVQFEPFAFEVSRIALVNSILGKGWAKYEVLREWELP